MTQPTPDDIRAAILSAVQHPRRIQGEWLNVHNWNHLLSFPQWLGDTDVQDVLNNLVNEGLFETSASKRGSHFRLYRPCGETFTEDGKTLRFGKWGSIPKGGAK